MPKHLGNVTDMLPPYASASPARSFHQPVHSDTLTDDEDIIRIHDEGFVGTVAWSEDDFAAVSIDLPEDGVLLGAENDSVDFAIFEIVIFTDKDYVFVIYFGVDHGVSVNVKAVAGSDRVVHKEETIEVLLAEDAVSGAYGSEYWKRICCRSQNVGGEIGRYGYIVPHEIPGSRMQNLCKQFQFTLRQINLTAFDFGNGRSIAIASQICELLLCHF